MKPYGVKKRDRMCCPGHDKFPSHPYDITRRRSFVRRQRPAKKHARQGGKKESVGWET